MGDSGHSGGIQWSRIWQEGLLIFSFCILSPAEFGHSGIETGMVPRLTGTECNQNLVVCLITVCLAFVCLAITFTPVTKHNHNTLSSHHHQPQAHRRHSSLPPHVMSAHHGLKCVGCHISCQATPHAQTTNNAYIAMMCHVTTMAMMTATHNSHH